MSNGSVAPLDGKDHEAAVKVVYSLLFGNKLPYNRKAEIMKHSCWGAAMSDMNKRVSKLSAEDLTLLAKFFGADGPAMDWDAPRPGFRHRAEADQGYDTFDDAYTRFAGRGAWDVDLTRSSFRRSMVWNRVLASQ